MVGYAAPVSSGRQTMRGSSRHTGRKRSASKSGATTAALYRSVTKDPILPFHSFYGSIHSTVRCESQIKVFLELSTTGGGTVGEKLSVDEPALVNNYSTDMPIQSLKNLVNN